MIFEVLTLISTLIGLTATLKILTWRAPKANPEKDSLRTNPREGISIIKPIRGLEPDLEENLRSFFLLQKTVRFELLLSVKDPNDPAVKMIHNLQSQYPEVSAILIVDSPSIGLNPKVNNMYLAWQRARHDLILISDSNVRVPPEYLIHLLQVYSDRAELVSQAVFGTGAQSLGGHLDVIHLNSFYLKATAFLDLLGYQTVLGKCMLVSRRNFELVGGLMRIRNYLAEDLVAADRMRAAGFRIALSPQLLQQTTVMNSVSSYLKRHTRWARLRKCHVPLAYLIEPLMFETLWPTLLILTAQDLQQIHFGIACLMLQVLGALAIHAERIRDRQAWRSLPYTFIKDVLAPWIWIAGLVSNRVVWRGQVLHLKFGGLLQNPARRRLSFNRWTEIS